MATKRALKDRFDVYITPHNSNHRRTFHEDGAVGVGLRHFLLSLLEARQHVVGDDHGFELLLLGAGVLTVCVRVRVR